ncbi:MAG: glycosyltransferase [Cytophagaceae bacterium]
MNIVIIGLSITSSWGNGHATTYRSLVKELSKRNHKILFLERDVTRYASHRDLPDPNFCRLDLYNNLKELKSKYTNEIKNADLVIVGSYVPQGVEVGEWVQNTTRGIAAFYDIDTPVTLAKLEQGDFEYISPKIIPAYDLYLSCTGGKALEILENRYKSPKASALYCSFDPMFYHPEEEDIQWDLAYLGTYTDDRKTPLEKLMLQAAKEMPLGRFMVAGAEYPLDIDWPFNVEHIHHIPPSEHRCFYNSQRFALNITRADIVKAGYAPSMRLFEAAACGTPVISDYWEGLETLFKHGESILIARNKKDTINFLKDISEKERKQIGNNARKIVLNNHTAEHRAIELENYAAELMDITIV